MCGKYWTWKVWDQITLSSKKSEGSFFLYSWSLSGPCLSDSSNVNRRPRLLQVGYRYAPSRN